MTKGTDILFLFGLKYFGVREGLAPRSRNIPAQGGFK